ncbi:MAG: restriction endonuclease subunit S [Prolixibacteraceae bacterium]|nr:restriction endonuclease subunit S [Prolixibacteraceae bacterium]
MSWLQNIKTIKEVCEVIAGQSPEGKYYNKEGNGLPFYQGKKEFTDKEIGKPTTWTTKITKEAISGDILMSVRAPVGPVNFATQHICIGRGLAAIRATKNIDKDYLFYFFLKHESEIIGNTGAVFNSINKTQIGNIEIPIPPLPEQKQIVSILDKAFVAIDQAKANIERNIENAKELFQSKLNEIFSQKGEGWEEKRLQDISLEFGRGKSKHRPRNDKKLYGGDYPFVQTGDIRNSDKMVSKYTQSYNDVGLAQSKLWPRGTICITIAANIAETAIIDFDACFPDSIIGVVVDPSKANLDYTYYALQFLRTELQAKGKGSAQDNINMGTFQNQFFPFPDVSKQSSIVEQLDALKSDTNSLIKAYIKKEEILEELKKSILQKAFSGELTQKDVILEESPMAAEPSVDYRIKN